MREQVFLLLLCVACWIAVYFFCYRQRSKEISMRRVEAFKSKVIEPSSIQIWFPEKGKAAVLLLNDEFSNGVKYTFSKEFLEDLLEEIEKNEKTNH